MRLSPKHFFMISLELKDRILHSDVKALETAICEWMKEKMQFRSIFGFCNQMHSMWWCRIAYYVVRRNSWGKSYKTTSNNRRMLLFS